MRRRIGSGSVMRRKVGRVRGREGSWSSTRTGGGRGFNLHYQTISLITYLIISTYLITLLLSLLLAFFHETDCVNKLIIS